MSDMTQEEIDQALRANGGTPKAHAGGRHTKYDPKYCDEVVAFFDVPAYREVPVTFYSKDGSVSKETTEDRPNPPPHISAFARKIGVNKDTIYEWAKVHPEFSDALTRAREMRREMVIDNGLTGLYAPIPFKMAAYNYFGWKDVSRTEQTGKDGGAIEVKSLADQIRAAHGE